MLILEYARGMGLVMEVLDSKKHRDLHMVAIMEFATISAELIDTAQRGAALNAFQQHPRSIPILKRLIQGDTFLSRLRPGLPALMELHETRMR